MQDICGNINKPMTLMSLFDGSGGFPLAATMCGIAPITASEIEPFPIRVTTKRLPQVRHLGDINRLNGAEIPPVDIVSGGFPCTDISTAGNRGGLHSARSGLFFEMIRVVREMLEATQGAMPHWIVFENVPGLLSSNHGADWKEVMDEIAGLGFIADPNIIDAQEFGVAQRRKRIYIACCNRRYYDADNYNPADTFYRDKAMQRAVDAWGGETFAGVVTRFHEPKRQKLIEILETYVDDIYYLSKKACLGILRRAEARGKILPEILKIALETQAGLTVKGTVCDDVIGFHPGAISRLGNHNWTEQIGTLLADCGDNAPAVAIPIDIRNATRDNDKNSRAGSGIGADGDSAYTITADNAHAVAISNHPADSRVEIDESGTVQTLTRRCGSGGGNTPLVMSERSRAIVISDEVAATLSATDYKGSQIICTSKVYGIDAQNSNSQKSDNPYSGCHEMDTSRTIDTSACNGNGGQIICEPVDTAYSLEGNAVRPSHQGSGVNENLSFTLNTTEKHAVCYQDKVGALCASDSKFPQNQQIDEGKVVVENYQHSGYREVTTAGTIKASGGDYPGGENLLIENHYVVRRLVPRECAKLQGFDPAWCANLETSDPTDDDIAFWSEVWETHRRIVGTSTRPKSRKQIVKWLRNPHSDAAEYKLWGNGLCVHNALFVLQGIVSQMTQ
ncbi:DNA methyltransferase [Clostridia bacterium]|nr:DNA methyltransferase [Clostridia bacterium]